MNRYDGLYILEAQEKAGKEDPIKASLDAIEKEINALGGSVQGTQKMDRRRFERIADDVDSGFYVNVRFSMEPSQIVALRKKLSLGKAGVFRQFYLKANENEAVAA
ncbi:MAG: 30S ribosomal protein S6 [Verrucomicrobium sp.]|nr:30S ribosomal protein S6 [Verrucomicrobium sp.]